MTIYSKSQTTIEGLDELIEAFISLGYEATSYMLQGSNEAGQFVLNKTIQKVPVRTGDLKSKLKMVKAKKSSKYPYRVFSSITFGKGVAYAVPLELGHSLIISGSKVGVVKERPFLRPAADESKEEVVKTIASQMNKALVNMGGMK